ncbi:hypothetical protein WJX72_004106 [[Myrmecia] bisecta]|uniref:glycerophosphodiester phosphodiesterase n=1 Tax=[Myrmecia] bisecta TaxID=41462 RepID=A0AAW1PG59_9CHLO
MEMLVQAPTHTCRLGALLGGDEAVAIGGHRGMGANLLAGPYARATRYRENTIKSFNTAAAHGASFIEFDVQVTADGVPVIWHDDVVVTGESGRTIRRPIKDLTLSEFKGLSSLSARNALLRDFELEGGYRAAASVAWQCAEEDELPTLAEVFQQVPTQIGFDIEVKMTTPDHVPTTTAGEVDRVVGAILDEVQHISKHSRRTLVFSSFDPEVCAALRARQTQWPVMFLSAGGVDEHCDARRTSIDAAIGFALGTGLQGIILDAGALHAQQHMAGLARSKGLHVYTYGLQNDDPEWVRQQYMIGVQGAICDDVSHVASVVPQMIAAAPALRA